MVVLICIARDYLKERTGDIVEIFDRYAIKIVAYKHMSSIVCRYEYDIKCLVELDWLDWLG